MFFIYFVENRWEITKIELQKMNRIILSKILILVLFQSVDGILNPNFDDGGNIYWFCMQL